MTVINAHPHTQNYALLFLRVDLIADVFSTCSGGVARIVMDFPGPFGSYIRLTALLPPDALNLSLTFPLPSVLTDVLGLQGVC